MGRPDDGQPQRLLQSVRDALTHSMAAQKVPRGRIRLQVNFSVPRQARELYPYAHVDGQDVYKTSKSHAVEAYVEQVFMTASYAPQEEESSGERLIYALECFLYTLPKQRAAVLYVSKLDSSGWSPKLPAKHLESYLRSYSAVASTSTSSATPLQSSASITRVITEAFIRHFARLEHWAADDRLARVQHLSLHILARAQGAYLFPSSNENKNKHILTDGQLIKWWRRVVSSAAEQTQEDGLDVRKYYVIPGYDRLESHQLIALPESSSGWVYGHPYSARGAGLREGEPLPPLPLSGPHFGSHPHTTLLNLHPFFNPAHIATLLPHFPDDPKSRFIAELARDAHEHAMEQPSKRRAATGKASILASTESTQHGSLRNGTPPSRRSVTPSTPPPQRRANSRSGTSSPSPVKLTSSQRQSMRERSALDRVSADEFWARMAFRQECSSGNAVGVFVALFTRFPSVDTAAMGDMSRTTSNNSTVTGSTGRSMPGQPLALPYQMLQDIIFKRMMIDACDWSKEDGSAELTRAWQQAIGQALQRKGNLKLALGEERGEAELQMQDATQVGHGILWDTVETRGHTVTEIEQAEKDFHTQGGFEVLQASEKAATAMPVNVLSVKRKKKA